MDELISIHAPREGSDRLALGVSTVLSSFLSTLPARGATWTAFWLPAHREHFYPRSPRGERPAAVSEEVAKMAISIHAPREGSDCTKTKPAASPSTFLSTLPARGATSTRF